MLLRKRWRSAAPGQPAQLGRRPRAGRCWPAEPGRDGRSARAQPRSSARLRGSLGSASSSVLARTVGAQAQEKSSRARSRCAGACRGFPRGQGGGKRPRERRQSRSAQSWPRNSPGAAAAGPGPAALHLPPARLTPLPGSAPPCRGRLSAPVCSPSRLGRPRARRCLPPPQQVRRARTHLSAIASSAAPPATGAGCETRSRPRPGAARPRGPPAPPRVPLLGRPRRDGAGRAALAPAGGGQPLAAATAPGPSRARRIAARPGPAPQEGWKREGQKRNRSLSFGSAAAVFSLGHRRGSAAAIRCLRTATAGVASAERVMWGSGDRDSPPCPPGMSQVWPGSSRAGDSFVPARGRARGSPRQTRLAPLASAPAPSWHPPRMGMEGET